MQQILQVSLMNLANLKYRAASSLVICVGIGGVVAVLITVLAMATGLGDAFADAGDEDRAIVVRDGALAESLSSLTREATLAVETAPGVALLRSGLPAVSPEVVASVTLPRIEGDLLTPVSVRGVTAAAFEVRPELELVEGRYFSAGLHEIVAGKMASEQFQNLKVGDRVSFHNTDWSVVGVFQSNGDAHESELLTDAATLMSATNRTVFNSVTVRLASVASFAEFEDALESNPQLTVDVQRESDYYKGQSDRIAALISIVAYVVGTIMAVGALCGALNTMYSAVEVRTVEISTLRAIGFGALPVVVSVLIEALALALVGAGIGAAIAWLLFNDNTFMTGNALTSVALRLDVGGSLFVVGVAWACSIGFLGGLLPAIKAARRSVADGLRVVL